MKTVIRTLLFSALILTCGVVKSQDVLDSYVADGLRNNIVLKQRNIAFEKAMVSLDVANSYFSPTVGVQGNYTSGLGGRRIAIPVGDLLNPVYSTLNQLTNSEKFPQIANVNQNFFPYNFYDAKVHTAVPIINTDLIYNRRIAQQQSVMQELEVVIYKRELVRMIKVAYFNYLSALESVKIFESALRRSEEGKRVNESLLANGKGLPAYVLRSESEIETTLAQRADAERQIDNARLYFNFLLNRGSGDSISAEYDTESEFLTLNFLPDDTVSASHREELSVLRNSIDINSQLVLLNQRFWVPKVNGFLDLGSQAQNWQVDQHSKYYLVGLQLDIPVFSGFRNRHKTKLARLDQASAQLNYSGNQRQLDMNARVSRNNLFTANQNYHSAQKQLQAAQSYQRLIEKGYKEGVNTFIEGIDARTQLTQAQLEVTLTRYRVLSAAAQFERETASYVIASTEK